jgi:hypothetical protein
MPKQESEELSERSSAKDVICTETTAYRNEIIETIDGYLEKLKNQGMNKNRIKNRLKLLQLREKAHQPTKLPEIEKELWAMAADIEGPAARMQRNISLVIILYTLLAIASFVILTVTDAIILPSFSIPYSVLLMGLIGSLVSMYVKLPGVRVKEHMSYNLMIWFIISPAVAVIMAGICFGIVQILLSVFRIGLPDESWIFWILAWLVGFVNWVYIYDRISGGFKKSGSQSGHLKSEAAQGVAVDD